MKYYIFLFLFFSALAVTLNGCSKESTPTSNGITNNSPTTPKNPSPQDSATGIDDSSDVILTWESTDPDLNDTVKFDLYAGTSLPLSEVPLSGNLPNPTYNMGQLPFPGVTYYWKVKAHDNHGASSTGNTWRFTVRTRP
jgi:hypothetical protein